MNSPKKKKPSPQPSPTGRGSEKSGSSAQPQHERVKIRLLPTGVPGLDEILGAQGGPPGDGPGSPGGGGLSEFSFNIIAGAPGCGKTTLAHQIVFASASKERPALYFTILGEPAVKMLRYQQQYTFFDQSLIDGALRFINLSQFVLENDLDGVLDAIISEVEKSEPSIVVVDSFRTVIRRVQAAGASSAEMELQAFVQRLALHLTSWQVTSFLVGEYVESEIRDNPVFTVADGLIWLYQSVERNSIVRKLQVMKMRGQDTVPGLHTFRITHDGVQCFPRTFGLTAPKSGHIRGSGPRLSTGVPDLDKLMGGGIPEGDSFLLAGPSGAGKSILAGQFIHEGLKNGEPGVIAVFEELPAEYIRRAATLGLDFQTPIEEGRLKVIYIRPLDLSVDETVHEVVHAVREVGAKRVVLDSLVGFEMALAPDFRHEFRESLYRMIAALTRLGVTVCSTVEIEEDFTSMGLSNFAISFLSDDILRLRYVSIDGQWRKMMLVVKMRSSTHSIDMWEYHITEKGMEVGETIRGLQGLTSGIPSPWWPIPAPGSAGGDLPQPPPERSSRKPKGRGRKKS